MVSGGTWTGSCSLIMSADLLATLTASARDWGGGRVDTSLIALASFAWALVSCSRNLLGASRRGTLIKIWTRLNHVRKFAESQPFKFTRQVYFSEVFLRERSAGTPSADWGPSTKAPGSRLASTGPRGAFSAFPAVLGPGSLKC